MTGAYRALRLQRYAIALFRCGALQPGMGVSRTGIYFGRPLLIASSFGNIVRNAGLCPAVPSDAFEIVGIHLFWNRSRMNFNNE
jgi:hypothetical protein